MTRETKIGLLLGMGVILLIGIIISDQLSQVQQDPADFTGFAAETQGSIDFSDAAPAPGYTTIPAPGQKQNTTPTGPSPVTDVPNEFFIPDDVRATLPQRQADATPDANVQSSLTAYNLDPSSNPLPPRSDDGVATLTFGGPPSDMPHYVQNTPAPTPTPAVERAPETRTAPTGSVSVIRHTVQADESLIKIARRYYGSDAYWRAIALANPGKVTRDGGVLAGTVLDIPKRDDAVLGLDIDSVIPAERQIQVDTRIASSSGGTIEVQSGDTLSELASKHLGTATRWEELLEANKDQLDGPQSLRVGMKLKLPGGSSAITQASNTSGNSATARATTSTKTYTVRPGDNLTQIAERTLRDGDKWKLIFEANRDKLKSPDRLVVGQELKIPG
ncbi:MAG: LysM peptidoglycan-binding domain-containing protein [Phycisphaerales bacterium]